MENQNIIPDQLKFTKADWILVDAMRSVCIEKSIIDFEKNQNKDLFLLASKIILQKINYRIENE